MQGLQGPQGPSGVTNIPMSDTVFVSATGSDGSGQIGNMARPFRTISAAIAAAKTITSIQRTVSISSGTYEVDGLVIDYSLYIQGTVGTLIKAITPITITGTTSYTNIRADNVAFYASNSTLFTLTGKCNLLCYSCRLDAEHPALGYLDAPHPNNAEA